MAFEIFSEDCSMLLLVVGILGRYLIKVPFDFMDFEPIICLGEFSFVPI